MPVILLALVLAVSSLVGIWLARRQIAHVTAWRGRVPDDFAGVIGLEEHARAADYTAAKQRLAIVEELWHLATTLAWLLFGIGLAHRAIGLAVASPVLAGTCLILAVSLVSGVLDLPFEAAKTFGVEARFGFNRSSPALFVLDRLKEGLLSLAVGGPLAYALLWLVGTASSGWWLWAWLGFLVFAGSMIVVYPLWIAPLFNRFSPLPEGEVKQRVEALLAKAGYQAGGLFVMDGSKRSNHANAYFTGFGRTKRIVFYDTLIEKLSADEIEAVLAHELGHFRHRDVIWSLARLAVAALVVFFWLGVAVKEPWFTVWMGLPPTPAVAVVVAMFVLGPVGLVIAPLANWMSWRAEWRADAFAAALTGGAEHLASALIKITRNSASTLTPEPLFARYHYSHPPLPLRLDRLRECR